MSKRASGDGSWGRKNIKGVEYISFRKTYNGKRKYFYGRTKKEIKEKVDKFERMNNLQSEEVIGKMILTDYMNNWLQNVKALSIKRKTYDTYSDVIRCYIENTELGCCQMKYLNSDVITNHYKVMVDRYSMSVIKKVHSILNMSLDYAFKRGDIEKNPMILVDLPSRSSIKFERTKKEIEVLSDDDIELFFKEIQRVNKQGEAMNGREGTSVYGVNKYIITLILYTGLRIGEALGLKWSNWDIDNNMLEVKYNYVLVKNNDDEQSNKRIGMVYEPKTRSGIRNVPLPERAIWALKGLWQNKMDNYLNTEFICVSSNGKQPSQATLTRTLRKVIERSGCHVDVKSFGLHDLRHTYASYHLRHGTDILVVSKLLGHKSPITTMQVYAHIIERQKIDAVMKVNSIDSSTDVNNHEKVVYI